MSVVEEMDQAELVFEFPERFHPGEVMSALIELYSEVNGFIEWALYGGHGSAVPVEEIRNKLGSKKEG